MPDSLVSKASVSGSTAIAHSGKGKKQAWTDDDISATGDSASRNVVNGKPGASEWWCNVNMPDALVTKVDPKASISRRSRITLDSEDKKQAWTEDDDSAAGDCCSIKVQKEAWRIRMIDVMYISHVIISWAHIACIVLQHHLAMKSPLMMVISSYLELIWPLKPKRNIDPYEDMYLEKDMFVLEAVERDIYLGYMGWYEYQTTLTWTEMCILKWKGKLRVDLEELYSYRGAASYGYIVSLDFTPYMELEDRMEGLKQWVSSHIVADPH